MVTFFPSLQCHMPSRIRVAVSLLFVRRLEACRAARGNTADWYCSHPSRATFAIIGWTATRVTRLCPRGEDGYMSSWVASEARMADCLHCIANRTATISTDVWGAREWVALQSDGTAHSGLTIASVGACFSADLPCWVAIRRECVPLHATHSLCGQCCSSARAFTRACKGTCTVASNEIRLERAPAKG